MAMLSGLGIVDSHKNNSSDICQTKVPSAVAAPISAAALEEVLLSESSACPRADEPNQFSRSKAFTTPAASMPPPGFPTSSAAGLSSGFSSLSQWYDIIVEAREDPGNEILRGQGHQKEFL